MSRTGAVIHVICDECGEEVEINLTALALRNAWDERNVNDRLESYGWVRDGDKDLCDNCIREKEEANTAYKAETCQSCHHDLNQCSCLGRVPKQ